MKNYVQDGDTITAAAPYDVASGAGALIGVMFAVAIQPLASGKSGEWRRRGVMDITKATGEAWTAFATKLYWDNTNKRLTSTAASNTLVGVAALNAASGDTVGRALITGQIA